VKTITAAQYRQTAALQRRAAAVLELSGKADAANFARAIAFLCGMRAARVS
jgi:hypothetical protein